MKKASIVILLVIGLSTGGWAMEGHKSQGKEMQMTAEVTPNEGAGSFKHEGVAKGLRAMFEVMSLASMGMESEGGATHHIMVKFIDEDYKFPVTDVRGKMKVISPSGKERVIELKDYQGTFAANLTFRDSGKYGVICLVKVGGEKHIYKFWFTHG
jgi:hypothetical protein